MGGEGREKEREDRRKRVKMERTEQCMLPWFTSFRRTVHRDLFVKFRPLTVMNMKHFK